MAPPESRGMLSVRGVCDLLLAFRCTKGLTVEGTGRNKMFLWALPGQLALLNDQYLVTHCNRGHAMCNEKDGGRPLQQLDRIGDQT